MTAKTGRLRFAASTSAVTLLRQIEHAQTQRKVQQFAAFLSDEVLHCHGSNAQMRIVRHFVGVLLCLNIGELSEFVGQHRKGDKDELFELNLDLNAYLGALVEVLRSYGGDPLALDGDDFITLWKCPPDQSIPDILHTVVLCASVLQKHLGSYETKAHGTLRLQTVISCGNVSFGIVGEHAVKRAIFVGPAVDALRATHRAAPFGAVVVNDVCWQHMLQEWYAHTIVGDTATVIITHVLYISRDAKTKQRLDEMHVEAVRLVGEHFKQRDRLARMLLSTRIMANAKLHAEFVQMLPLRKEVATASHHWTIEEMRPLLHDVVYEELMDSQPGDYLTEMKALTMLFVRVAVATSDRTAILGAASACFSTIVEQAQATSAAVHDVHVHDNIIVYGLSFGLFVTQRDNMASLALKTGRTLKRLLALKEHVREVAAGIAFGSVFCSVVGHPLRKVYIMLGECICKARRLALVDGSHVRCDVTIFKEAHLTSAYFTRVQDAGDGQKDILLDFDDELVGDEPVTRDHTLVGRRGDFKRIVDMICGQELAAGYTGICVQAPAKLGKTTLLLHVFDVCRAHHCDTVMVCLHMATLRPYYCIAEIYRQLHELLATVHNDIEDFSGLPRALLSFSAPLDDFNEDIAIQKYRTLNRFRDLVAFAERTLVIIVDNVHYIDPLSWEILELTFPAAGLRLVLSASPRELSKELAQRLSENDALRIHHLRSLQVRHMAPLVCALMRVDAVSRALLDAIVLICRGNPGIVEALLLYLTNIRALALRLDTPAMINPDEFFYGDVEALRSDDRVFVAMHFRPGKARLVELRADAIYADLLDSLSPFLQHVLATAALIGTIFGRQMLYLALKAPGEEALASAIETLFEQKVFACASQVMAQSLPHPHPSAMPLCCCCRFEAPTPITHPRYAFCKLIQFRDVGLQLVAYERLSTNLRHELHVLCAGLIERTEHICPTCMRNPSNYYAFFGDYNAFVELCENPTRETRDFYATAKRHHERIREAVRRHAQPVGVDFHDADSFLLEEKYVPIERHYDPTGCQCLDMLFLVYQDLIRHARCINAPAKIAFYTLKLGLVQMCMRDVEAAMSTLHEARERSLADGMDRLFRQYHVGMASIALAVCSLRVRNVARAKCNVLLALRQFDVPLAAFTSRCCRFLLRRRSSGLFGWELGTALLVTAKVVSLEGAWRLARDCCRHGVELLKTANRNLSLLVDAHADVVRIYRMAGDRFSCERLEKYLVREFQLRFARDDSFVFHLLFDMLAIVLNTLLARGALTAAVHLGYRFLRLADGAPMLPLDPSVVLQVAELNLYQLAFAHVADLLAILKRASNLHYHLLCMITFHATGFHALPPTGVQKFARRHLGARARSLHERQLRWFIHVHLLRAGRFEPAAEWANEEEDAPTPPELAAAGRVGVQLLLLQVEAGILQLLRSVRMRNEAQERDDEVRLRVLFAQLRNGVKRSDTLHRPAYLGLLAWYHVVHGRTIASMAKLRRMHAAASKANNVYHQALALRLKNHWRGGFALDYESRPSVPLREAISYSFLQFVQFLHPYVLP